jgi:hypothetical protein
MLAPNVRFEGFTYTDWTRVLALFRPMRLEDQPRDPQRAQGLIVAVHHGGRVLKLLHSKVGRLRLDDVASDWPLSAAELASRHHASWAVSMELGALDTAMADVGRRLTRTDDMASQWLILLDALRLQMELGRLELWPDRLQGLPMPTAPMLDRSFDMVCPPGKTMLIGLFEGHDLWTSIACRRGPVGIDLVLGPAGLRSELGLLSGDFRRDHRHLARHVSDVAGPLSLGCFTDRHTFRQLEVDPTPGAWAMAVAVRDVVLSPVPPAMALPLGLDAGRAAFSALRHVASRIDSGGFLPSALGLFRASPLGQTIEATLGGDEPGRRFEDLLGFNPLELLRKLLARDQ